jgi:hypothetical protein
VAPCSGWLCPYRTEGTGQGRVFRDRQQFFALRMSDLYRFVSIANKCAHKIGRIDMVNVANVAGRTAVQNTSPSPTDQAADKFETEMREASTATSSTPGPSDKSKATMRQRSSSAADGSQQGTKVSGNVRSPHGLDAGETVPLGKQLQADGFVNSIKSTANGADVARILTAASNAGEINQVLSDLSPPELNSVAKELNGLSSYQQVTLCNSIVTHGASGANLAKLTKAFINNPPSSWTAKSLATPIGGAPPLLPLDLAASLESSVANGASAETRVDYIKALAPEIETNADVAGAVGTVLTSLNGNARAVNQAFGVFYKSPRELNAVLTADDGAQFVGIVNAAATKGAHPAMQAQVFRAATQAFTEIFAPTPFQWDQPQPFDPEKPAALSALTSLLESNPQAVIYQLRGQDLTGSALTTYVQEMVQRGDLPQLSTLVDKLRFGPGPIDPKNPDVYIEEYGNAEDLGYFFGAVSQGIQNLQNDNAADTQTMGNIISGAAALMSAIYPEATAPAAIANTALQQYINNAENAPNDQMDNFKTLLLETALKSYAPGAKANDYEITLGAQNAFWDGYNPVVEG